MKLRRLHIGRLPGIDESFTLEDFADGFHVIVGPNGIGKSSLCRAMRPLLWRDLGSSEHMTVSALFERDGERWSVERDGSRYRWQRDGIDTDPPPLPAEHLHGCFFLGLRDLLDASSDAGRGIATEIRRQMSGGFDLEEAAASLFGTIGPRFGRKERGALDDVSREVRQVEARQVELANREAELTTLEGQVADAERAQQRLPHFDTARELHALRSERDQVAGELAALPQALEQLSGRELEQVEQREGELEEKRRQVRDAEATEEASREEEAASRLADTVEPALLETLRTRANDLADLDVRLEGAQEEWKGKQAAVAEASRLMGGPTEPPPDIDIQGGADLFAFLREARQAEEKVGVIDERLRLLAKGTRSEEDQRRLELLPQGIEPLRAWLRAPDPDVGRRGEGRSASRRLILAVAIALLALGGVLGLALAPVLAAIAGLGLGLVAALWLTRPDPSVGYARKAAQREFPGNLEPPSSWTADRVTPRLREMESELAKLEASSMRARDREVERGTVESGREAAERRLPEIEKKRRELAAHLGLAAIPADAELVDTVRALDGLRQARGTERDAAARVEKIEKRHGVLLSELAAALTLRGEAEPMSVASARAGVTSLANRDQALRSARDRRKSAAQTLRQLNEDIARIQDIIAEIYREADLEAGDQVGLARLLERLEGHRQLRIDGDALATSITIAEPKLAKAGESGLVERDPAQLKAEKQRLEHQVMGLDELRSQISDIRAEVGQAREGRLLEDALAKRSMLLERLRDCREEALLVTTGRFLLETVRREHETVQLPSVLERARQLFSTFTHHAYELQVPADDTASFVATEARSGIGRRPDELSDGTRAQLLLAARLAFAEEAAPGFRPPLFLDEALDHSDPVRFRAISRSLGRMVEDEGRQIIYLTNGPNDVQAIQEALKEEGCDPAQVIDLAQVRKRAAGVTGPETLRVDPLPLVPDPSGETPESYGAALRVPPLDPRRGSIGQHLFYLLWDDLLLLRRLLESQIEHVGQWITLSRGGAELANQVAVEGGVGAQLDARAELLEEFCRGWCEGRGLTVDREAIERSGCVSERYLEDVIEIAREIGGDGEHVVEALRARDDERLQGFRTKAAEAFESFLTEEGYIDPRPILAEADLVVLVLGTPVAARLPQGMAAGCVHRWWSLCERATSE